MSDTWTCPKCGESVPHTSYQIAKHQVRDLEAENDILAERCAKAELMMEKSWQDNHVDARIKVYRDRCHAAEDERDALGTEVRIVESLESLTKDRDALRAEVERLKENLYSARFPEGT